MKNYNFIKKLIFAFMAMMFIVLLAKFYSIIKINRQLDEARKSAIISDTIIKNSSINPEFLDGENSFETENPSIDKFNANSENIKEINQEIIELRQAFDNEDIIGYISVEDTTINYPIVQGVDNEFYLHNDFFKNPNVSGAIFLDFDNNSDITDYNNVIYGHNMRKSIMFHDVRNYMNPDYLKSHAQISIITLYDTTLWEVFSSYTTSTSFDYIKTDFGDKESFKSFLEQIKSKSNTNTNIEVTENDKIITLSTCTGGAEDMRYAIHAKLISRK